MRPQTHREAEHLRHKIGGEGHQPHGHPSSSGGGGQAVLSVSPAPGGSSMLGCSPPTGSFMARLAAAAGGPLLATSAGACVWAAAHLSMSSVRGLRLQLLHS